MISHPQERLLSFDQVIQYLPKKNNGKLLHYKTVARWAYKGLRGVILETIMIGGRRYTSQEACQRFFEALTRASD